MKRLPIHGVMLCRESSSTYNETLSSAEAAADLFQRLCGGRATEHLCIIALDAKNRFIGFHIAHIGSIDSTMCKADTIFRYALLAGAKSIIIGHNHPSGDPTPSESDVETTFQMVHAGSILGINVHDHIVFTDNTMWVSLKQKGYL